MVRLTKAEKILIIAALENLSESMESSKTEIGNIIDLLSFAAEEQGSEATLRKQFGFTFTREGEPKNTAKANKGVKRELSRALKKLERNFSL